MSVRLAAAAVALVTAAGLAPLALSPAGAATDRADGQGEVLLRAVPNRPAKGEAWIQGKVLDRAKQPILDINVEAYLAGDRDGDPVSSSLTYTPTYRDDDGWYRLYGLEPGQRYRVKYSSIDETGDSYRTVWSKVFRPGDREAIELAAQTMTLTRKVDADLGLEFKDATVKPRQKAKLRVSLTSAEVDPIAGDLYVKIDKQKTWKTPIKDHNDGQVTIKLPRQELGAHTVAVRFGGNDAVKPTKKPVKLKFWVTRNGR